MTVPWITKKKLQAFWSDNLILKLCLLFITSWKLTPLPNFHWTSKVICVPFLLVLWQFCTMSFDPTPYKSSPCHPTQLISCYLFMFYTLSTTSASYIFMHVWPSGGMWLTYQGYNLQGQWLSPSSYWLPIDPRLAVGFHAHLPSPWWDLLWFWLAQGLCVHWVHTAMHCLWLWQFSTLSHALGGGVQYRCSI